MSPVELDPTNPRFSTIHCFLKQQQQQKTPQRINQHNASLKNMHTFLSFNHGDYAILRKQKGIFLCQKFIRC